MRRVKRDSTPASAKTNYLSLEQQLHVNEMNSIAKIIQQKKIDRERLAALKGYLVDSSISERVVVSGIILT